MLDDDALLTPDLMRLTRWMADYYLCGWGQVLNAVVPAGAKDQAGTRSTAFLEAVPAGGMAGGRSRADVQTANGPGAAASCREAPGVQAAGPPGTVRRRADRSAR